MTQSLSESLWLYDNKFYPVRTVKDAGPHTEEASNNLTVQSIRCIKKVLCFPHRQIFEVSSCCITTVLGNVDSTSIFPNQASTGNLCISKNALATKVFASNGVRYPDTTPCIFHESFWFLRSWRRCVNAQ